ncbi:LppM family (lipo)protein [Brachybacterium sp. AOP43-C2-M15]|uniref:LppM family (lipo)protein n=1 Tax=Brachybacterium sp. AOP43-C2-M15 TaxID=3457661 RepID=UPI004034A2DE
MTSISTRRRLVAALLLPFLMVLAGCGKFHADLEIKDAETIEVAYDLAIDETLLEGLYSTADEMCAQMQDSGNLAGEMAPEVEPYEADGRFGCKVTGVLAKENFGTGLDLTEGDGEYHLVMTGDEAAADGLDPANMSMLEVDFRMTFTFPGRVIEASGGRIDGNSVTFSEFEDLRAGIDIRAEAGGFPWVIVLVVVLVLGFFFLLLLAAIAFFVIRARRNKGGGAGPGGVPGGYGAASGAAAGSVPPAAPQGQQWGQTSPPPAPQQGGQPWDQPQGGQQGEQQWGQQWGQAPQGEQPWSRPPAPQDGGDPQWGQGGQGQQPPQNPGW